MHKAFVFGEFSLSYGERVIVSVFLRKCLNISVLVSCCKDSGRLFHAWTPTKLVDAWDWVEQHCRSCEWLMFIKWYLSLGLWVNIVLSGQIKHLWTQKALHHCVISLSFKMLNLKKYGCVVISLWVCHWSNYLFLSIHLALSCGIPPQTTGQYVSCGWISE